MIKVILSSILGIGIILCGNAYQGQKSIAQDRDEPCRQDKWPTIVTCFIISSKYSDTGNYVVFGTGQKQKCKPLQNASCPYSWSSGCLSRYIDKNQSIK